ncbi:MAG: hypothetical protein IK088_04055, partial [Lachnospiraceae bacterium]|nr:hypothetical protein [Lachnospiraceae bacterium]
ISADLTGVSAVAEYAAAITEAHSYVELNAFGEIIAQVYVTDAEYGLMHAAGKALENYVLDDGAYLMVKLLIELANGKQKGYTPESLIKDLKEPKEAREFRFEIDDADFKTYGAKVLEDLGVYAKTRKGWSVLPKNYEGIRVNSQDGWFLLRMSLHDPILPLNIEGDSEGSVKRIANELAPFLRSYAIRSDKFDAFLGITE